MITEEYTKGKYFEQKKKKKKKKKKNQDSNISDWLLHISKSSKTII